MNEEKWRHLLKAYLNDTINEEDREVLLRFLGQSKDEAINDLVIDEADVNLDEGPVFEAEQSIRVLDHIMSDPRYKYALQPRKSLLLRMYSYRRRFTAAAVLLLVAVACWIFIQPHRQARISTGAAVVQQAIPPFKPGGNKATLRFSDGRVLVLDSIADGLIAHTGSIGIEKNNGQLSYQLPPSASAPFANLYNTLSTPKGGEYKVMLPDGTRVWLNAASSITYPMAFTTGQRKVSVTGEAYFEVASDKHRPFLVSVNNCEVQVLGTSFNIAAYTDEASVTTTLLDGALKVSGVSQSVLLQPGQQAITTANVAGVKVSKADIETAMAWKNGYFKFNDEPVSSIVKKISRWYDVDFVLKGKFESQRFGGTFYRSKSLEELLGYLGKIGTIHFAITGRTVVISE